MGHRGITTKLTLVLTLVVLVVVGGVVVVSYVGGRAALETAVTSELLTIRHEKESALEDWIVGALSDAVSLAGSPSTVAEAERLMRALERLSAEGAAADAARSHAALVNELRAQVGPSRHFQALLILEPLEGRVVVATNPAEEGKFREDQEYFTQGRLGPHVQALYYSVQLESPAMTASAPLRAPDGRLLGILAARLNLADLNTIIGRRSQTHASDDAFLVTRSLLFATQPRFIDDPAVLRRGIQTETSRRCIAGESGVDLADDYRGVPAVSAFRWIEPRGLCLIVKLDQSEALAPVREYSQTLAIASGLAVVLTAGIARVVAGSLTKPLLALTEDMRRFGKGEPRQRFEEDRADEVGVLIRTFDQMANELTQQDEALKNRAILLEESNKELEAFGYTVSHDLRAPLRAIDGYSRILLEEHAPALEPEAQRYLGVVRANAQQMGLLIDDLLRFSRLSREPLRTESVQPAAIVREVVADLRRSEPERCLEVVVDDLPACQADPRLLEQVYVNLIANAFKFTRRRETARVEVSFRQFDDGTAYFVRDNGAGFDMRYAGKLFGVFQRLHRAGEYEGTGVGLAIVQRIVHRHGGRIWAEAELGRGATFYFTLSEEVSI